jgi:hypothetical protein
VTDKTVTEREAVLRERKAFYCGAAHQHDTDAGGNQVWEEGRRRYPLPKVTRPRVVRDREGWKWQCIDGRIQWSGPRGWRFADVMTYAVRVTPERVVLWADLLANPTEDVEDDDASR